MKKESAKEVEQVEWQRAQTRLTGYV